MRAFSDWLAETGRVPDGVELPAGGGVGAVMSAVGRRTGPGSPALGLWRDLPGLYDRYCAEEGAARVTVVRAAPIGHANRRALGGLLGGAR